MFIRSVRIAFVLLVCAAGLRASEDPVAVRVLRRGNLPQTTRPLLPEDGWAVQRRAVRDTERFWQIQGTYVHLLCNVSEACAKDVAAYVELYTGQVMPVLREMFGREDGRTIPIRMYVYKAKEDAPRWWVRDKHGQRIWHDAEQGTLHWILEPDAGGGNLRVPGRDVPEMRYHLVRLLLRRFLPPQRFVEDAFISARPDFHYAPLRPGMQSGSGAIPEGDASAQRVRTFRERQTGEWLQVLDEWRGELGLDKPGATPDFERLRSGARAMRETQPFMHRRRTPRGGVGVYGSHDRFLRRGNWNLKDDEGNDISPEDAYKAWNNKLTSWRTDAASWNRLNGDERASLIDRLWALLRFWDDSPEEGESEAVQAWRRQSHRGLRPTISPAFEDGAAAFLGKAWDPYLKPEANFAYAQVSFNPLLLVRAHHPAFDPLVAYDPYAFEDGLLDPSEEGDPRLTWLDSKTLLEYGYFHGAYQINTEAQGFLLLSFLLNDMEGAAFLRELVFCMRHSNRFYRYEELDAAWEAYLERGVLRTVGGTGMDTDAFLASYGTVRESSLNQVDFEAEPTWGVLANHPLVRGTWMTGETRIRVTQTSNRLSIFGYAENGQMAFSGRATIHADGMLDGQVQYHRDNRTEPLQGRLAPDGDSLHPVDEEGSVKIPWRRVR